MGANTCPACGTLSAYSAGYDPPPDKLCGRCQDSHDERAAMTRAASMETSELVGAIVKNIIDDHLEQYHSGGSGWPEQRRQVEACRAELNQRLPRPVQREEPHP